MTTGKYNVAPREMSIHDKINAAFNRYNDGIINLDELADRIVQLRARSNANQAIHFMDANSLHATKLYIETIIEAKK